MNESTGQSPRVVSGLFSDRESTERVYSSLTSRGYSKDDVNLLMSDQTRDRYFGEGTADKELGSKALEGAGAGSAIGREEWAGEGERFASAFLSVTFTNRPAVRRSRWVIRSR